MHPCSLQQLQATQSQEFASVHQDTFTCQTFPSLSSILCSQVAIKSIRKDKVKDEQDLMHIRREIEIMSSLNHPHIIAIHEGTEEGCLTGTEGVCVYVCV